MNKERINSWIKKNTNRLGLVSFFFIVLILGSFLTISLQDVLEGREHACTSLGNDFVFQYGTGLLKCSKIEDGKLIIREYTKIDGNWLEVIENVELRAMQSVRDKQ